MKKFAALIISMAFYQAAFSTSSYQHMFLSDASPKGAQRVSSYVNAYESAACAAWDTEGDLTPKASSVSNAYQGTSAYIDNWMPKQKPTYTVRINNSGSLGVLISIGGMQVSYLSSGGIAVYGPDSNPELLSLDPNKGLSVSWSIYPGGASGSCGFLDLNTHQILTVNGDWGYCG